MHAEIAPRVAHNVAGSIPANDDRVQPRGGVYVPDRFGAPVDVFVGDTRREGRSILKRRNARSSTGLINSVRDGRPHIFESRPEALNLAILDSDPAVGWFASQPETFSLPGGRRYTPDTLVIFRRTGRIVYQDVKLAYRLERDPDFDGRLADIIAACAARGADFEVVPELHFRDSVRLRNASRVRRSVRRVQPEDCRRVYELLRSGPLALGDLERESGLDHAATYAALTLCVKGFAQFDASKPISCETVIRLEA